MRAIGVALWVLSWVSACCSACFMVIGLMHAEGPGQQAAIGALGSAWVVVPYVAARSWDELTRRG
jgi:hypothetical protein